MATPYCTLADVNTWIASDRAISDQAGKPLGPTVTVWIADFSGKMNLSLKKGGVSPIPPVDPDQLSALKILLARKIVFEVMAQRSSASIANDKVKPYYSNWAKEFDDALAAIEKNGMSVLINPETGEPWSADMETTLNFPDDPMGPQVIREQIF